MSALARACLCVCVVKLEMLERDGEEKGGKCCPKNAYILLLLGSILWEGGGCGKLDLVSSSIN